jgi:hypothetical protein
VNGTSEGRIAYEGLRTADEVYKYIRSYKPMQPKIVKSQAELKRIRDQLSHHLVVGLIYDKPKGEVDELVRALQEI